MSTEIIAWDDDDTVAIVAWADNTWEYLEDYSPEDWTHKSDDYAITHVPAGTNEDQIEEYVRAFNRGELQ